MDNDRRKIELMNALLLSMPGTPVLYYGDEIGMGDNYYLGDRDGVRTPMQWSADRNGGFSPRQPAGALPAADQDPVYGFQAVNVEAQQNEPVVAAQLDAPHDRRAQAAQGLRPRHAAPSSIRATARSSPISASYEDERILCVANLSRQAQAVELDLAEFSGAVPVELTGGAAFPPIGDLPYLLTLPAYGFFWFLLAAEADAPQLARRRRPSRCRNSSR